jgi:tRNA1(Val) A37 N6-methylase TrmN6
VFHPGLALHDNDGRYTAEANAILREAALLDMATPRL